MMNNKKSVILIVEGQSERIALGSVLERIASVLNLRINVVHGDITSESSSSPVTIKKRVGDLVRAEMKRSAFTQRDVVQVMQLMDTDGAFVPSNAIIERPMASAHPFRRGCGSLDLIYSETNIMTNDRTGTENNCFRKARNMQILRGMSDICKIPYAAFYVSRNLEHALDANIGNLSDDEKMRIAAKLRELYVDDIIRFKKLISDPDLVKFENTSGNFRERYARSWDYIEKSDSLHSLARASNVVLLVELLETLGDAHTAQANFRNPPLC